MPWRSAAWRLLPLPTPGAAVWAPAMGPWRRCASGGCSRPLPPLPPDGGAGQPRPRTWPPGKVSLQQTAAQTRFPQMSAQSAEKMGLGLCELKGTDECEVCRFLFRLPADGECNRRNHVHAQYSRRRKRAATQRIPAVETIRTQTGARALDKTHTQKRFRHCETTHTHREGPTLDIRAERHRLCCPCSRAAQGLRTRWPQPCPGTAPCMPTKGRSAQIPMSM